MLLFLSLHVWRCSDEEGIKEKLNFGTSWNWCRMEVLMMVFLLKLHIWKNSSFQGTWTKQTETT